VVTLHWVFGSSGEAPTSQLGTSQLAGLHNSRRLRLDGPGAGIAFYVEGTPMNIEVPNTCRGDYGQVFWLSSPCPAVAGTKPT
jgi:hypothetical protein